MGNIIQGSEVKTQPFYVAIITPVIHYCMGGLEIDAEGAVIGKNGPIKGLYCAGEVAGGVHGNNRLGGNSLLDCVVFGRVTGVAATKYILGNDMKKVNLKEFIKNAEANKPKAPAAVVAAPSKPPAGHVALTVKSQNPPGSAEAQQARVDVGGLVFKIIVGACAGFAFCAIKFNVPCWTNCQ